MRKFVAGKLHGLRITGADLDYHGSITLDPDHCEAVGFLPMEYVDVWNKTNGARLSTYVIYGQRGSRCCILNGAAARLCQKGDELILCNHIYGDETSLVHHVPRVLTFNETNHVVDKLLYTAEPNGKGGWQFEVLSQSEKPVQS
jgi:aspartate 1-decarboxylase